MKRSWRVGFALATLVLLPALVLLGCEGTSGPTRPKTHETLLDQTPRENYEAEAAALWLSGDLVAPDGLYAELLSGFSAVRGEFGDSIPELLDITFKPPWVVGEILVLLTPEATEQFRRGEYTDWDSLNTALQLDSIDTSLFDGLLSLLILEFEGRLHPDRLVEMYCKIPSVATVEPNGLMSFSKNVYPWVIEGGSSYLFELGWGDCPSGCLFARYWYFKIVEGDLVYLGTVELPTEPKPDWWKEAEVAMLTHHWSYANRPHCAQFD